MQRRERKSGIRGIHLLGYMLIGAAFLVSCTTVRMTMTARSGLEQKLLVRGIERAVAKLDVEALRGRRVNLEVVGLAMDELPFAKEMIVARLAKNGVRVVPNSEKIEFKVKVLANMLAVDQTETLLGTPEFTVLGIPIPAISVYRQVRNRGRAEMQMYVFSDNEETLVHEFPLALGEAKYDRHTILFIIGWTTSDIDKKPHEVVEPKK